MTSALPGGAAPPHPMRHLETSAEQEDDDALIEKLRTRAWDPGMRFDSEQMAELYADAPHGPLFPPVTLAELEHAESRIGRQLPGVLRRVYTEVANGGFGPDSGLASLTDGNRTPGHPIDWPSAVRDHERGHVQGMPTSWLYLTSGGCSMEWYVSLLAIDNPVLLYDSGGWDPTWGQRPHDGLRHATASLRQWLWTWANGGNVWDEVLSR
ncbi:SMI1/KNR4 family protein [Streptomyces sp. NPDC003343]